MQRRDFMRLATLGMAAGASAAASRARPATAAGGAGPASVKARMTVGTQHDSSDEVLGVLAALGVTHICSRLPSARYDEAWSVDGLTRLRERVESYGIALDMVPLPLSSSEIAKAENPNILL